MCEPVCVYRVTHRWSKQGVPAVRDVRFRQESQALFCWQGSASVGFSAESVSTRLFCPVNRGASLDNTRSSIRVCLAKDSVRICLRLGPRRVVAELTELLRPNVFDPQFWFWFFRPIKFRNYPTRRLHSGSFLGLPYRILNIHHNKELLWSLWVKPINTAYSPRVGQTMAPKKVRNLIKGQLAQGFPIH